MTVYRAASETDLMTITEILYEHELQDMPSAPPEFDAPRYLQHVLRTGALWVAEQEGIVVGVSGSITRAATRFLTDLFVLSGIQSSGVGRALLDLAMPADENSRFTVSSTDFRAQSLYIRSGMQPGWPHYNLRRDGVYADVPPATVEVVEAHRDDADLLAWDAEISGRSRPEDHAFWLDEERGVPLWFYSGGEPLGYGYVRPGAGTWLHPNVCKIGPIGVARAANAANCVLAAIHYARRYATVLWIDVAGPHPALAPLLEAGFRIAYVEEFMSSAPSPIFDPQRYIASDSDLF